MKKQQASSNDAAPEVGQSKGKGKMPAASENRPKGKEYVQSKGKQKVPDVSGRNKKECGYGCFFEESTGSLTYDVSLLLI